MIGKCRLGRGRGNFLQKVPPSPPQTPPHPPQRLSTLSNPCSQGFSCGPKEGVGGRFGKRGPYFFRWQREKREGKTTKACLPLLFSLGPQKKNIISESRRTSGGRVKPFTFPAVLRAFWGNSTQRAATPWPLGGLAGLTRIASRAIPQKQGQGAVALCRRRRTSIRSDHVRSVSDLPGADGIRVPRLWGPSPH